jgi:hypothetical protein
VGDAAGGFIEEQGFCEIGAVDEDVEGLAKLLELFGAGALFGEAEAGAGGDAVRAMAVLAARFFEGGHDFGGEIRFAGRAEFLLAQEQGQSDAKEEGAA